MALEHARRADVDVVLLQRGEVGLMELIIVNDNLGGTPILGNLHLLMLYPLVNKQFAMENHSFS